MYSGVLIFIVIPILVLAGYLVYRIVRFFMGYLVDARKVTAYQRKVLERELDDNKNENP